MLKNIAALLIALLLLACSAEPAPQTPHRGKIALSFDDAPRGDGAYYIGTERTPAFIKALKAADIPPVVFFVTTKGFEKPGGKSRVQYYAAAGHLIANHSYSHQWTSRAGLKATIADIDRAEAELAGIENRRPWFRFPYLDEGNTLDVRDGIRAALSQRGIKNGYVTVDNYDWYFASLWKQAVIEGRTVNVDALRQAYVDMLIGAVDFYDALAVEAFGETAPHVILLHENDLAALFVGDLVAALRARGWEIISPDEAYAHPAAAIVPKTLRTRSGHFAALAMENGRDPRTTDNMAINEAMLDAFLEKRQVFGPKAEGQKP